MGNLARRIQPTVKNRIVALDVLRGVAILGILLANIFAFAFPQISNPISLTALTDLNPSEQLTEAVRNMLVSGKFRGMLAILFGVGLYLQYTKRRSVPGAWPNSYLVRMAILLVIGFCHAIFLWWGDILFLYAATAFIALLFVKVSDRILLWISIGLILISAMCGAGLDVAKYSFAGGGMEGMDLNLFGDETKTFAAGTYWEQTLFRGKVWLTVLAQIPMMIPEILALMLIGIWLGRHGVLADPRRNSRTLGNLALIGFGGLILNSITILTFVSGSGLEFTYLVDFGLNAPLAIGYIALVTWLTTITWLKPVNWMIGQIGRFALTNYLLQSVICTAIFYSWGGGYFGKFGYGQAFGVVILVWLANIVFTLIWGAFFMMGPVEWIWRRLSTGNPLRILKSSVESMNPVPPPRML